MHTSHPVGHLRFLISMAAPSRIRAPLALLGALTIAALFSLAVGAQTLPLSDATLSALTLNDGTSDVDLKPAFTSAVASYRTAVKYRDERLTVTATTTDTNATIAFLDQWNGILDDADPNTLGRQVDVPVGGSMFKVRVTAQDRTTTKVYEVVVERDSAYLFGWTPTRDLNDLAAAGNASPQGIWSDGTTMWVADDEDDNLYAYTLATGARDATKDISLHSDNDSPTGIWSDETTIWVADDGDDKLYAYTLSGGARDTSKEFSLHADNGDPAGIWSDGTTIWVANNSNAPRKVFAYTLSGGANDSDKEFVPNWDPVGIWAHGTTMWVINDVGSIVGNRVEAYTIDLNPDGTAGPNHGLWDTDKQFAPRSTGGTTPVGIWSDNKGAVWITAPNSRKVESYHMFPFSAGSTTLSALAINDGTSAAPLRPTFALTTLTYRTSVTDDVNRVTVSATPSENTATVAYLDANGEALVDADSNIAGFQVDVAVGTTPIHILVTGQDGAALIQSAFVERDSALPGGRTPTDDVYDLDPVAINFPFGIWSDGTTMWLTNQSKPTVYAYTLATSTRNASAEFNLDADNGDHWGIWSDGTTIWVVDNADDKLYAYTLATGARDATKEFDLDAANGEARGLWSDGTTVWITDVSAIQLFAYTLATGARDTTKEFDLTATTRRSGIWSDGTTLWVADIKARTLFAYTLANGARDPARDIALIQPFPHGVSGQGSTIWVADAGLAFYAVSTALHRVYSYRLPPSSPNDVTLSSLGVSPSPLLPPFTANLRPAFSFARVSYRVAVPNQASRVTVSATASNSATMVAYRDANGDVLADADSNAAGFQVDVAVGETAIAIRLAAGGTSLTYTVIVERNSAELYGWTPTKDLNNLLQDNPALASSAIRGVWANETTLYVTPFHVPKVFAYTRATGARDESKDIATNQGSRLTEYGFKTGIWSDGTTMWVLNYRYGEDVNGNEGGYGTGKVFAFNLSDGARDTTKEFPLHLETSHAARGIWSDGTTVWVSDRNAAKLFAYTLATGARVPASDITLHHLNNYAQGIWSDGTTIWVAQLNSPKFFAYTLATGAYDPDKDFDRVPGNLFPRDIWSDGTTLYVPDHYDQKLFAYRMTFANEARLHSLELSRVPLGETFDRANEMYMATTAAGETTVTATPLDPDATTVIKLNGTVDADGTVDLGLGSNNVITVEVTAEDGTTKKTYTVTVTREAPDAVPAPRLPSVDDPNAIWLATLTVEDLGSNQYGYDVAEYNLTDTAFTYLGDNASISSNSHFTMVGMPYTIDELYYSAGNFYLSLNEQFEHDDADNISVVVGGTELKFSDAINDSSPNTYSWTMPNPSWSPGDEVKVKIVVLKDADGPENLTATTTLVATMVLVPTTTKYEDVYKTYDMTLTWSTPTTGGAVTGYRVEYQPDPALQWQRLQGSRQTGTTYTLSGLKRSTVGYYRVAALRSGTPASYSDVVRVQAETETEEIPEEVGYLVAKRAGSDTALKLAWNRAYTLDSRDVTVDLKTLGRNDVPYALSNRARATSYEVQYVEDNGDYGEYGYPLRREGEDWVTVTVRNWTSRLGWQNWLGAIEEIEFEKGRADSPDLQTVVKGLEPGTRYYVRVRGCTDGGCSGWMIPYLKTTSGMKTSNATEADPLTATLQDIPANHDGSTAFTFRIAFSAEVTISRRNMRDHALTVSGGTVTDARRVDSRKDLWELTVAPAGTGAVSILALQNRACTETGALCTADGRMLSTGLGRTVPGPSPQGQRSPAPLANSTATGTPTISGTAQVGETLTARTSGISDADGLTDVSYSYQWIRNDGSTDTRIQDATGSSYILVEADEGQTIKVKVSFTDDAGNNETLSSGEYDAVAAPQPPAKPTGLSAAVSHDTVTLTWDNPQDDAITGYVILRRDREIHPQGTFVTITGDTGSADTTYIDDTVEPDKQYVYRIKAINEHGEVSERSHWVRAYTPAAPDPAG